MDKDRAFRRISAMGHDSLRLGRNCFLHLRYWACKNPRNIFSACLFLIFVRAYGEWEDIEPFIQNLDLADAVLDSPRITLFVVFFLILFLLMHILDPRPFCILLATMVLFWQELATNVQLFHSLQDEEHDEKQPKDSGKKEKPKVGIPKGSRRPVPAPAPAHRPQPVPQQQPGVEEPKQRSSSSTSGSRSANKRNGKGNGNGSWGKGKGKGRKK
ncbi:hypothetical protein EG329_009177 [Mollisiaceae sp. DMI_Dod_QoI]|nr:hypothetical protein EG329_009177 [Helotiales sp. DMI_Dod_QoI]